MFLKTHLICSLRAVSLFRSLVVVVYSFIYVDVHSDEWYHYKSRWLLISLRRQVLTFYAAAAFWELKIVSYEWSFKKPRPLQPTFFGCLLCAQDQDVKLCCLCKTRTCYLFIVSFRHLSLKLSEIWPTTSPTMAVPRVYIKNYGG